MNSTIFLTRRGTFTRFARIITLFLIPSYFLTLPQVYAAALSEPLRSDHPSPVLTPGRVRVNRTPPQVQKPAASLIFTANPSDAEISQKGFFEEPLIAFGATSPAENKALAAALTVFQGRRERDDFSALERFLAGYPKSAWTIALSTNLGLLYRRTGWYSKAIDIWRAVWNQNATITKNPPKLLIDRSLAELIGMTARVGRAEELEQLIIQAKNRNLMGSSRQKIDDSEQGLFLMKSRPETSFRCGPMAVEKLRNILDHNDPTKLKIKSDVSSKKGTSFLQLKRLSKKLGMDYQVAQRLPGSAILSPAVVHWKVGHFAALVSDNGKLLRLQDPTFGEEVTVSHRALDAEASGYFLVPAGKLPEGWSPVSDELAKTIWGKGVNNGSNPNNNKGPKPRPKCGCPPATPSPTTAAPPAPEATKNMAVASMEPAVASLNVEDTPLYYTPPVGPEVYFHLTYSQREAGQPSTFTYSNVGPLWTFDWFSYIADNGPGQGAAFEYMRGGGQLVYNNYQPVTRTYDPQPQTGARLKLNEDNSYELTYPDGSKEIFGVPTSTAAVGYRKVLLTKAIDPQGRALSYTYDSLFRLVAVTDAIGQVTTVSYDLPSDRYKITKITDPFGRTAVLTYSQAGLLASSTDMLGLTTRYNYASSSMTSFETPYGTTSFSLGQDNDKRWVEITDPQGAKERIETFNNAANTPASETQVPAGEDNQYLNLRNTFYWSKKAMVDAPGDYSKAVIYHWLHEPGLSVMSDQLESMRAPLESRVYFNYPGQSDPIITGTSGQPSRTVRILDDGSTQQTFATYNSRQLPLQMTDPLGRVTNYTYSADDFDLIKVAQQNGANRDVLFSATYNAIHLPLTVTDASGQTTTYTYNSWNQVATIKNAKGEISTFGYDANHYLTTLTGAQAGAVYTLGYDGFGRVRTTTDPAGYTVTRDYDNLDRITKITYPSGQYEQYVYTNLDLIQSRDRNARWTRMTYNPVRQLVATLDAQGHVTNYERCLCGELKALVDPLGQRTAWAQDIEGRTTSKTYADGTKILYGYEAKTSRLKTMTDAKGQVTTYNYNVDDSLSQAVYTNATVATPSLNYTYDPVYPRLTSLSDGTGTTTFVYNPITGTPTLGAGRLGSETGPLGTTAKISYSYDALGRYVAGTVGDTARGVTYDTLGRVTAATNVLGTFNYGYVGAMERLQTRNGPNGLTTTYGYLDHVNDDRLASMVNKFGSTPLSKFDYQYDAVGNIISKQEQADAATPTLWSYGYDRSGQLTSAIKIDTVSKAVLNNYVYNYDLAGNRTSEQIGLGVAKTAYNSINQITGSTGGGPLQFNGKLSEPGTVTVGGDSGTVDAQNHFSGSVNVTAGTNQVNVVARDVSGNSTTNKYQVVVPPALAIAPSYDLNGNTLNNGAGQTYAWDAKNQLVSINYAGGAIQNNVTRTEFTYDGFSRWVKIVERNSAGIILSTKQHLWVGNSIAEERDATNAVMKRFFAQGVQVGTNNYYYTFDQLGNTREMCNSSGTIVARYSYDPYGRTTLVSGTDLASFQYAGMYKHQTSGFYLTKYRAYDPTTAHWLSRDPAGEIETDNGDDDDGTVGGMNLYGYVDNDPLNFYDSDGLGKEGSRNANRKGHRGKRNSDKHSQAKSHGGKKKKGFDYQPKRQPDGTMKFCPLPSPGPLPAPIQPSPVPPVSEPSPDDNPSPAGVDIYPPPPLTPTQTAEEVGLGAGLLLILEVILIPN